MSVYVFDDGNRCTTMTMYGYTYSLLYVPCVVTWNDYKDNMIDPIYKRPKFIMI